MLHIGRIRAALKVPRVQYALIGLTVFAVYAGAAFFWIDEVDEGYFLDLAWRVQHGQLPYRDFDSYYTPGIFYLYGWLMQLTGVSVIPVRLLMALVRAVMAVVLFRLTYRLVPSWLALLPFVLIMLLDRTPITPEPHPAWLAMLATLVTLELVVMHVETGRRRWLVGAGVAVGVAFLFKQNVGAFAALAVAGYVLLRRPEQSGWVLRLGQALMGLTIALGATILLRPALEPFLAFNLWLPVLACLVVLVGWAWTAERGAWHSSVGSTVADGTAAGLSFGVVTLAWLIPLTLTLGVDATPFKLFVGEVNQGALLLPLAAPPRLTPVLVLLALWLPIGVALLFRRRSGPPRRMVLGAAAGAGSLLMPWLPLFGEVPSVWPEDATMEGWLNDLETHVGSLHLYLPGLCAWAGLSVLVVRLLRGRPPGTLPWVVLFATLASLALYPRSDTLHVLFAAAPAFILGALATDRALRVLSGSASWPRRAGVLAALLAIPAIALAPQVLWRYATLVQPPGQIERNEYVFLDLPGAPVWLPRRNAEMIHDAVSYLRANVPPDAPLFVYPAAPLFNVLTERPNPTRFNHLLPGALTERDLEEVVHDLEASRPRYILWDHGGSYFWVTDPYNRLVSDYIWRCYRQVEAFDLYLILERQDC